MKATGIVRRVDDLGRIVLPKDLRQTMGIRTGDPMEIYTDADNIILRKYAPGCAFCGIMVPMMEVLARRKRRKRASCTEAKNSSREFFCEELMGAKFWWSLVIYDELAGLPIFP